MRKLVILLVALVAVSQARKVKGSLGLDKCTISNCKDFLNTQLISNALKEGFEKYLDSSMPVISQKAQAMLRLKGANDWSMSLLEAYVTGFEEHRKQMGVKLGEIITVKEAINAVNTAFNTKKITLQTKDKMLDYLNHSFENFRRWMLAYIRVGGPSDQSLEKMKAYEEGWNKAAAPNLGRYRRGRN